MSFPPDLRIVHIVPILSVGGMWRVLLSTLQHSDPSDKHTILALFRWPTDFARQTLGSSFEGLEFDRKDFGSRSAITHRLSEVLEKYRPHIIHSHHFYSDLYALPAARSLKLIAIRSVHGITQVDPENPTGDRGPRYDWSEAEIAEEAKLEEVVSKTVVVSYDLKKRMESYGFVSSKLEVIYPGVDSAKFGDRASSCRLSNRFRVGFIGRLEPVKNPRILPLIARHLKSAGVSCEFTIIGDGRQRDELKKDIEESSLTNFQILPETPNVSTAMRTFDVLVVPSLSEGVPHVILEAMASGLPVVASRVGGIPEVIEDRVTGHLCTPGDVEGFASRLVESQRDMVATRAIIERAGCQVRSKFEAATQYARLRALYVSVLVSS